MQPIHRAQFTAVISHQRALQSSLPNITLAASGDVYSRHVHAHCYTFCYLKGRMIRGPLAMRPGDHGGVVGVRGSLARLAAGWPAAFDGTACINETVYCGLVDGRKFQVGPLPSVHNQARSLAGTTRFVQTLKFRLKYRRSHGSVTALLE